MPSIPVPKASQIINGLQFDWSSVEIQVDNVPHGGVKSITWDHGLTPGEGRGTRSQVTLRSRGKYAANASIEMYAFEYQAMIALMGKGGLRGYMEYDFRIDVHYVETLSMIGFAINGCRIMKEAHNVSEDGGLLVVKADLHVMSIEPKVPGANTSLYAVDPLRKFIKP
jgi:hypothetical protein